MKTRLALAALVLVAGTAGAQQQQPATGGMANGASMQDSSAMKSSTKKHSTKKHATKKKAAMSDSTAMTKSPA